MIRQTFICIIFTLLCTEIPYALDANSGKNRQVGIMNITINGTTLKASLYDNSSAHALLALLQKKTITIEMHDYGNFEKVGDLPVSLPRNDKQINTDAGDLILYQGKSFVIYYDTHSWNFTPLGKLEGITKTELKVLLGKGNVTVVLEKAK